MVVLPSGFKKFVYIYTLKGMRHQMNLGAYPAVTLTEARERYNTASLMVLRKEDPQAADKVFEPRGFNEFAELQTRDNLTCSKTTQGSPIMSNSKNTVTKTQTATVEFIEIPAKVCVQIGLRKRYFGSREAAVAALAEFTAKHNRVKGTRAKSLTPEQKAQKAQTRVTLEQYAVHKGLEGKRIAALANMLEDLCADFHGVHALIEAFVTGGGGERR